MTQTILLLKNEFVCLKISPTRTSELFSCLNNILTSHWNNSENISQTLINQYINNLNKGIIYIYFKGQTLRIVWMNILYVYLNKCIFLCIFCILTSDGPSNVSISQPLIEHLRPKQSLSLSCFAYDAFPGVTYMWSGIACVQHELPTVGSTCSFTPSVSDDGKTVACTAVNLRDTNLSMTATYEIHFTGEWRHF